MEITGGGSPEKVLHLEETGGMEECEECSATSEHVLHGVRLCHEHWIKRVESDAPVIRVEEESVSATVEDLRAKRDSLVDKVVELCEQIAALNKAIQVME